MGSLVEQLRQEKLVGIIRGIPYAEGENTARALVDGGITFLEVTLDTENALTMIADLQDMFGKDVQVGAGTVLNLDMAKDAVSAGAQYIVSPNTDEKVIDFGISKGLDVWPGALTPTEIVRAYEAGASAVKVFPIGSMGKDYIKNIRGPISHIPLMGTGGITQENIQHYLSQGLVAAGLGGNLVNKQLVQDKNFSAITKLAEQYREKVKG